MSEALCLPAELSARTPGWTLAADYYLDGDVFAAELASVFATGWLFAGHTCELAGPGDFVRFDLGDESVIVVRDRDGTLHAHHNVCRHRGSRVCSEPRGTVRAFVCPYHQWTYGLDGTLRAARLMGDGFAKSGFGLAPVVVREVAGLVFVCLAADPPDFDAFAAVVTAQLGPHSLASARIVHRQSYRVQANWKTLVENNRECYHCRGSHPEFLESNFEYGRRPSTFSQSASRGAGGPASPAGAAEVADEVRSAVISVRTASRSSDPAPDAS